MGVPVIMTDRPTFIVDSRDLGRSDSLRHKVVTLVREEAYDQAVKMLTDHLNAPTPFPKYPSRIQRFVEHAVDLVRAIEMKRNFPGINRLTAARQQDLKLKVKQHVDELIFILKRIEAVEVSLRVEDVRSTVIVMHSIVLSAFALAVVAFVMELSQGLMMTGVVVVDDLFQDLSNWLFAFLG